MISEIITFKSIKKSKNCYSTHSMHLKYIRYQTFIFIFIIYIYIIIFIFKEKYLNGNNITLASIIRSEPFFSSIEYTLCQGQMA